MISPTTSPSYYGGASATSDVASKSTLDKDAFLKLLVAQLRNQDPSSPLQPHEMAAQLAQFTSVEQLSQLNTAMAFQTEATQMAALVGQTSLSASLIGRQVLALGDQVTIPATGTGKVHVDVGGAGGVGTLKIMNSSGAVVATRDIGQVSAGAQDLTLPGDLPPGTWRYSLEVKTVGDKSVSVTTYTRGVVSAIEFKNGKIVLHAGKMDISLDDLVQIEPVPTGSGASSGAGSGEGRAGGGALGAATSALRMLTGLSIF